MFPIIEPQINLLKSNLERLKSSILVMLNVLIFAEQLRNQEALPILKEQRELVRNLLEDKNESEAKFQRVLRAIESSKPADAGPPWPAAHLAPFVASTAGSDTSAASIRDDIQSATVTAPQLPLTLKARKEEIRHQCALLRKVTDEIGFGYYKVDYGLRDRMHRGILGAHWDGWHHLRKLYGDSVLLEAFSEVPAVTQYWISKFEAEAVEAMNSSESESVLETSSEFDGLEEASEDGQFLGALQRSMTMSQLDVDVESNDVQPHEESHVQSDPLDTRGSAEIQGCDACRRQKVQCDLGAPDSTQNPPCTRCRRDGEECSFSTTWRTASSTTGNLTSVEEVTLLRETAGLKKQEPDEKRIAHLRPTYIKVHRKYLLPETLNLYQLPWSAYFPAEKPLEKYIDDDLFDELLAHIRKTKRRKLFNPYDRKKDKMFPMDRVDYESRKALESSRPSSPAQELQQLPHEEEIDGSQSVSTPPRQQAQKQLRRQKKCYSAAPIESMENAEPHHPSPSILPESSLKAARYQSGDYFSGREAVDDLSEGDTKSSAKQGSNHKDNDEVDELLARWTTLAQSEFY